MGMIQNRQYGGRESEEDGDAGPRMSQIRKPTTWLQNRQKVFPVFVDAYSNSATPFRQLRKETNHDTIDHRRNPSSPESRRHRYRGRGKKYHPRLQANEHPPPPYQRQRCVLASFLLASNAQIVGEARAFAADQLFLQESAIRF